MWYNLVAMVKLNAHFDGKVFVPDEPLSLAPNQKVRISVEPIDAPSKKPKRILGQQPGAFRYIAPDFDDAPPTNSGSPKMGQRTASETHDNRVECYVALSVNAHDA